jgi:hypothetical protein
MQGNMMIRKSASQTKVYNQFLPCLDNLRLAF